MKSELQHGVVSLVMLLAAVVVSGAAFVGERSSKDVLSEVNGRLEREFIGHDGLLLDYVGEIPTAEDIAELRPNAMGWRTPIANGSMFTGEWLPALMAEGVEKKPTVERCVRGLIKMSEISDVPGYIARATGTDGKSHFPCGSNDQTDPWFFALFSYCRWQYADPALKAKALKRMVTVAHALEENGWNIPCDGKFKGENRGAMNSVKMPFWGATRFLFLLKAIYGLTDDAHWDEVYRKVKAERLADIERGAEVDEKVFKSCYTSGAWIYVPSAEALAELIRMETDPADRERLRRGFASYAAKVAPLMKECVKYDNRIELPFKFANWREGYKWRPQETQKDAEKVSNTGNPEILGTHRKLERNFMSNPLAAAAICALQGDRRYREQILATLRFYDYSQANLSEFLHGAIAAAALLSADNGECDVCIVGGGAAGIAAALQSAGAGARTVLVERGFQVGGNMTTGGVSWPGLFHAWGRQIIDGCGWDLVTNCVAEAGGRLPDFASDPGKEHWRHQVRVNAALFSIMAEEALVRAGVELRYHTEPMSAEATSDGWRLSLVAGGETRTLNAKVLVDATGNGALSVLCGARRMRDESAQQPGSYTYLIDPHADEAALDWTTIERNRREAVAEGRLQPTDLARGVRFLVHQSALMHRDFADGPDHGTTIANYVEGADNSTAELRADTNMRGRASLLRVYRFLRSQPGLENASLVWISPEVGVRETWRVEGEYVITGNDYVSGRDFEDAVCNAFYPIDIHDAGGVKPKHLAMGVVAKVPRRALVVKGCRNLLIAGRCISSDRNANAALRVQATCMATGQAAGEMAALAALRGCLPQELPLDVVRAELMKSGAIVK